MFAFWTHVDHICGGVPFVIFIGLFYLCLDNVKLKDVLAMILPNCVEFPIIFSGAASVNVPTTTMSPIYTPFEIARQLKFSGATMAVTNTSLLPAVSEAVANVYQETKKHIKIILTGKNAKRSNDN